MSKKVKVLIISSLVIIVLLIGIIIGNVSQRFFKEDFLKRQPPDLAVTLPTDKQKLFFNTMKRVHLENRDIHKQIRTTREKIFSILAASEFDEDAYQKEVDKIHKLYGLMMQRLANANKELAQEFSQEERKALAEYLRRPPRLPQNFRFPRKGPPHRGALQE